MQAPDKYFKLFKKIASLFYRWVRNQYLQLHNDNLVLGSNVRIAKIVLGKNIYIGSNSQIIGSTILDCSYVGDRCTINNSKIGKFCSIGPGVLIGLGKHPTKGFVSTSPYFYSPKDFKNFSFADKQYFNEFEAIEIGNDVWIGANSILLDGLKIGDGVIIAASSVVTKDIEPYCIYGGIPAKLIRKRFSDEEIEFLINFKWWNKDLGWLKENFKLFHNIDVFREILK